MSVECGSHRGEFCIPAPRENEYCDPNARDWCPCERNLACRAEGSKRKVKKHELEKYLEDVCKHHKEGKKCPDRKKLQSREGQEDHYVCRPGSTKQDGLPNVGVGASQQVRILTI